MREDDWITRLYYGLDISDNFIILNKRNEI